MPQELTRLMKDWAKSRPKNVQKAIEKCPPNTCYRNKRGNGHYVIYSYGEDGEGEPVTLSVMHGKDSFLPGFRVFGIGLDDLVKCDCGKYEMSKENLAEITAEQNEYEKANADSEKRSL